MKIDAPYDKDHPKSYRVSTAKLIDDIYVREVGYNRVPCGLKQIMKRNVYILHYVIAEKDAFWTKNLAKTAFMRLYPMSLKWLKRIRNILTKHIG